MALRTRIHGSYATVLTMRGPYAAPRPASIRTRILPTTQAVTTVLVALLLQRPIADNWCRTVLAQFKPMLMKKKGWPTRRWLQSDGCLADTLPQCPVHLLDSATMIGVRLRLPGYPHVPQSAQVGLVHGLRSRASIPPGQPVPACSLWSHVQAYRNSPCPDAQPQATPLGGRPPHGPTTAQGLPMCWNGPSCNRGLMTAPGTLSREQQSGRYFVDDRSADTTNPRSVPPRG